MKTKEFIDKVELGGICAYGLVKALVNVYLFEAAEQRHLEHRTPQNVGQVALTANVDLGP